MKSFPFLSGFLPIRHEEFEYQWQTPQFSATSVQYTQNLGKEKYQRVVDGIDKTIGEFIAESTEYKNLSDMLRKEIYSSKTVTTLAAGLYGAFDSDEMRAAASMLGIAATPRQLASQLADGKYSAARDQLARYASWKAVKPEGINWGFAAGDKKGFENALCAVLSPLNSELKMLLCCGEGEIFGSIRLGGANGYNTAVIPLLEAIGCPDNSIMTYEQYKADKSDNAAVKNLVRPLMALIDRIVKRPIYTLTEILPNLVFFVQNGSLTQCIANLIAPMLKIAEQFGIAPDTLGLDKIAQTDFISIASGMIADLGKEAKIKLPQPQLASLASLGQLETVQSKRTFEGKACTAPYVRADQTAVLITLLRYIVGVIKAPENIHLVNEMMSGGQSSPDDMFAMYSQNIGSEMEKMTVDETIEWLYKLFFRERAVSKSVEGKEYVPHIIYVPSKSSEYKKIASSVFFVLLAAAAAVCIIKREKIFDYAEEKRQQKLKKKLEEELLSNQEV